jgi:hypothetical protein
MTELDGWASNDREVALGWGLMWLRAQFRLSVVKGARRKRQLAPLASQKR